MSLFRDSLFNLRFVSGREEVSGRIARRRHPVQSRVRRAELGFVGREDRSVSKNIFAAAVQSAVAVRSELENRKQAR